MGPNTVEIVEMERLTDIKVHPDVRHFRFPYRWWLPKWTERYARKVWWWLSGSHFEEEVVSYKRHVVDENRLIDAASRACAAATFHEGLPPDDVLFLIGTDQWMEILENPENQTCIEHKFQSHWTQETLFGMKIVAVPWMQGMVVVPRRYLKGFS